MHVRLVQKFSGRGVNMLIKAKYEGYCRKCGRPIFVNDVFDYNPDSSSNSKALCLFAIQEIQEKIAAITGLLLKRNSIFQAQIDTVAPDTQIPGLIKILPA